MLISSPLPFEIIATFAARNYSMSSPVEVRRSPFGRILLAVLALALLAGAAIVISLLSWRADQRAVVEFACNGTVVHYRQGDEYNQGLLTVRNDDGTPATLESWALAPTEDELQAGAKIVKRPFEPFALVDGEPVTFLRQK